MNTRPRPYRFRTRWQPRAWLAVTLGIWLGGGTALIWACNVPVFRYAMAYWEPDPFHVVLLYRGELSEEQQRDIEVLQRGAADKERPANLSVVAVNLDQPVDERLQPILAGVREPESLPWVHVAYPASSRLRNPAFSAAWNSGTAEALLDSPARREIVTRLARGEAAVWVLLTSSDAEADAQAAELIGEQLPVITERLVSGDYVAGTGSSGEGQDLLLADRPDEPLQLPDVPLAFSLLTVDRQSEDERFLVSMLLGSEPDLAEFDSPIVIPVFGRGRSYYALVGGGITASNLFELSAFLVGSCSCEVKADNPGTDLLFAANWDSMVSSELREERPLPALTGLGAFESGELLSARTPDRGEGELAVAAPRSETSGTTGGDAGERTAAGAAADAVSESARTSGGGAIPLRFTIVGVLLVVLALAAIGTFSLTRRPAI
jgi:hypothetical protein